MGAEICSEGQDDNSNLEAATFIGVVLWACGSLARCFRRRSRGPEARTREGTRSSCCCCLICLLPRCLTHSLTWQDDQELQRGSRGGIAGRCRRGGTRSVAAVHVHLHGRRVGLAIRSVALVARSWRRRLRLQRPELPVRDQHLRQHQHAVLPRRRCLPNDAVRSHGRWFGCAGRLGCFLYVVVVSRRALVLSCSHARCSQPTEPASASSSRTVATRATARQVSLARASSRLRATCPSPKTPWSIRWWSS